MSKIIVVKVRFSDSFCNFSYPACTDDFTSSFSEHQHVRGGFIEINENRTRAFFLTKHSLDYSRLPSIGAKMRVNVKPFQSSKSWAPDVPYIAVTLFTHGDAVGVSDAIKNKCSMLPLAK